MGTVDRATGGTRRATLDPIIDDKPLKTTKKHKGMLERGFEKMEMPKVGPQAPSDTLGNKNAGSPWKPMGRK
jgi:hypothetical protein